MQVNVGCQNCGNRQNPDFVLGSAVLTLGIGSLAFLVSLSWANYVNKKIDLIIGTENEMKARLYYAVTLTLIAIVVIFLMLYYLPGQKC